MNVDELCITAPTTMWHGNRGEEIKKIKPLSVNDILDESRYRQIFGGSFSLTDSFDEAKNYASHPSPLEVQTGMIKAKKPQVYELELSQENKFFDASQEMDYQTFRNKIVPLIPWLFDEYQKLNPSGMDLTMQSVAGLAELVQDNVDQQLERFNLMSILSMANPFINMFATLYRGISIAYQLTGITGLVPQATTLMKDIPEDMRDYSVHDITQLKIKGLKEK